MRRRVDGWMNAALWRALGLAGVLRAALAAGRAERRDLGGGVVLYRVRP